ncbi:uncharacterized protein METZ01_LOCUS240083, partial [marine metagenome]
MKDLINILFISFLVFPNLAYSEQPQIVKNRDSLDINYKDDDFCDHFFVADTHYLS